MQSGKIEKLYKMILVNEVSRSYRYFWTSALTVLIIYFFLYAHAQRF